MSHASARRARRAEGQRLLDELAVDHLACAGVSREAMFGSHGLRVNGKFFAFVSPDGELIVKVPAPRATTLLASGDAGQVYAGRNPMREWIRVPMAAARDGAGRWPVLLRDAHEYVRSLTSPCD